jgi:hypothetical protein
MTIQQMMHRPFDIDARTALRAHLEVPVDDEAIAPGQFAVDVRRDK